MRCPSCTTIHEYDAYVLACAIPRVPNRYSLICCPACFHVYREGFEFGVCSKCGCSGLSKWPKEKLWRCANWECGHLQHEDGTGASLSEQAKWLAYRLKP